MTALEVAEPILVLERVRRLLYQTLTEDKDLLDSLTADQLVYLLLRRESNG